MIKKQAIKARTYLQALKLRFKGHHVGDPFRVYEINPNEVKYAVFPDDLSHQIPSFGITHDAWSEVAAKFESHPVYQMLVAHFVEGIAWEETERFRSLKARLKQGGRTNHMDIPAEHQTIATYRSYLEYIDTLFERIQSEGYLNQTELSADDDFAHRSLPPSLNEIQVMIDSEGTIGQCYGAHRLSIAKILNLDSVPVRTRVRNVNWQLIRDKIATAETVDKLSQGDKDYLSHPDLGDLSLVDS